MFVAELLLEKLLIVKFSMTNSKLSVNVMLSASLLLMEVQFFSYMRMGVGGGYV